MKRLPQLNIYRGMNNGDINIGKVTLLGAFFILFLDGILSPLFSTFILKFALNIVTKGSTLYNILHFVGEFIGATLSLLIICLILRAINKTRSTPNPGARSVENGYYYAALLVIGFRVLFEGSIGHITRALPMPEIIVEAFQRMSISPLYLLLSICFFAPFIEEFMYRGILLNGFLNKYSPKIAIPLSALIFALAHMNLPQGINAFILGIILGTVFYKTRSLYLCIFMHFINNLCAQFICLIPLGTALVILQSIIFTLAGGYLMYRALKGLRIII